MKKICSKRAHFKRGLAFAIAASVALTSVDITSFAALDDEVEPIEISDFEELSEDVAYQQLSVGASEADIVFPNSLKALKTGEYNNEDDWLVEEASDEQAEDNSGSSEGVSEDVQPGEAVQDDAITEEPSQENGESEEEQPADDASEDASQESSEEGVVARLIDKLLKLDLFSGFSATAYAAESDEINVTGVTWVLNEELSDNSSFQTDTEWLRYVYSPEIPEYYVTAAELPNITVDIIGTQVLGEVRTGDSSEEMFKAIADSTGKFSYLSKGKTATKLTDVLQNTKDETGADANPIIGADDVEKIEIISAESSDTELFEAKKLLINESGEPQKDETTGEYSTPASEEDKSNWFLITKKGFVTEGKTLSVTLKFKEKKEGQEETDVEKTFTISMTADVEDEQKVDVSVSKTYTFTNAEQTLAKADVVVKIGEGEAQKTLTLDTDYEVEEVKKTNAGTYDFKVTFKGETYGTLGRATGKWTIAPVSVKAVADSKLIFVKGKEQTYTYELQFPDGSPESLTNVKTIEGIEVACAMLNPEKIGEYSISISTNQVSETDKANYTISTEEGACVVISATPYLYYTVNGTKYKYSNNIVMADDGYDYDAYATVGLDGIEDIYNITMAKGGITAYYYKEDETDLTSQPNDVGDYKVAVAIDITGITRKDKTTKVTIKNTYVPTTEKLDYSIRRSLSKAKVTVSGTFTYNGKEQSPTVSVTYNNTKLEKGTDYTLSGETSGEDADTYTLTVTGKGYYSGTVSAEWKISPKSISGAYIKTATVDNDSKTTISNSSSTRSVSIPYTDSEVTLEVSELSLSGFDTLELDEDFEIVDESKLTIKKGSTTSDTSSSFTMKGTGNFTGNLSGTFVVKKSSTSKAGTGSVTYSKTSGITTNTTSVESTGIKSYASKQTDGAKYVLKVQSKSDTSLSSSMDNAISSLAEDSVTVNAFDITVTKTDTSGNESQIHDLNGTIDVVMSIGTSNATRSIYVFREHDGTIKQFTRLESTPTSYQDGTFYVNRNSGKIYIYSRYFSDYAVVYSGVEKSSSSSSSSSSSTSNGATKGARAPQTGDNLPVIWVWVIVLLAGVGIIGFSAFELRRVKRGDLKKKR